MKFLLIPAIMLAGFTFNLQAQQDADEKYIGIYSLIQQANNLADSGNANEALPALLDTQNQLQKFQKKFPAWNPNIISFRLNQVADRIEEFKAQLPTPKVAEPNKVEQPKSATPPPNNPNDNLQPPLETDRLRTELLTAQAANELLQAKLKEALSVQPAASNPRELERAQEKIRWLMKENNLLKASRGSVEAKKIKSLVVTNYVTVYVTNKPIEVTNFVDVFVKKSLPTIETNYVLTVSVDTNALEALRLHLANARKNFVDEHARAEALADQLTKLKPAAAPKAVDESELAALREENAKLKSLVATLQAKPATPGSSDKQASALVAALQSELEIAKMEKLALQNKLQNVLAGTKSATTIADYEARIRELTLERNALMEKLDLANHQKSGGKPADSVAQISNLTDEVKVLRSRLAVAEATPVPYTAEELALFKTAAPAVANPESEKKSIKELPSGTADLVASAQSHFVRQEFSAAEADYLKILERDENNGIALANLATIELQQNKLDEAERHITAALRQTPDDAYNLSTLGYLKFRQEKYDDALSALSRAAQLDPGSSEIQNYLGVTLSHKGQRKAAETALRHAIQLSPNYAPAHNNLAVIYLSQQPPMAALARWHYQKALDAGQPRNPDLEKILTDKGSPVAP